MQNKKLWLAVMVRVLFRFSLSALTFRRYPMKQLRLITTVFAAVGGLIALNGIQARAQQPDSHHEHFAKRAKACADCQVSCDSCFRHCATLVANGKKEHVKTMHACVDCADYCALAAKLSARQSSFSATACDGCAKTCDECAKECEKFKDDKHTVDCAKSCRDCAKACRTMIGHLKH
jgi:hypothetical protein